MWDILKWIEVLPHSWLFHAMQSVNFTPVPPNRSSALPIVKSTFPLLRWFTRATTPPQKYPKDQNDRTPIATGILELLGHHNTWVLQILGDRRIDIILTNIILIMSVTTPRLNHRLNSISHALYQWSHLWSSKSFQILMTTSFIIFNEVIWPCSFEIQCFMCAQMFSIGLRSGELEECWWHFIPSSCLTGIHTFLCTGALSSITISSLISSNDSFQNSCSGSVNIWSL